MNFIALVVTLGFNAKGGDSNLRVFVDMIPIHDIALILVHMSSTDFLIVGIICVIAGASLKATEGIVLVPE